MTIQACRGLEPEGTLPLWGQGQQEGGATRSRARRVGGFSPVAPTSHARQCTAPPRLMPAPRAPAASRGKGKFWPSRPRWTCAHAHRGGRPGGAGGISRPFFGAGCLALVPPNNLFRASGHIFNKDCHKKYSKPTTHLDIRRRGVVVI